LLAKRQGGSREVRKAPDPIGFLFGFGVVGRNSTRPSREAGSSRLYHLFGGMVKNGGTVVTAKIPALAVGLCRIVNSPQNVYCNILTIANTYIQRLLSDEVLMRLISTDTLWFL
jgi:hypothetical protein